MTSNSAVLTLPRKVVLILLGLLAAVAVAAFTPSTAQAQNYNIWVGDVQVTDSNAGNILANSHNGSTGTARLVVVDPDSDHYALYLENANIKVADASFFDAAGIYIGSGVNLVDIVLKGNNTITMPSGTLHADYINGIAGYGTSLNSSSIRITGNPAGANLSMTLSGGNPWTRVYGIYNKNDGVDVEHANLSMMLSCEGDVYGIFAGYDGIVASDDMVNIVKATVNMSISSGEDVVGIESQYNVYLYESTMRLNIGQSGACNGQVHGVHAYNSSESQPKRFDALGNSNVAINIGTNTGRSYGFVNTDVNSAGDSEIHVHVGYSPVASAAMAGSTLLIVEEGSIVEFSGYTQAIEPPVSVFPLTISNGVFVSSSPSFQGGFAWDETAGSLSSYKYIHFPQPLSIAEAVIGAISDQNYTGKAITPAITVIFGNAVLSAVTDYTVSYANNINPGEATVTVTGKGLFSGTKTAVFTISSPVKWERIWGQTAPVTMQKIAAKFGTTKSAIVTTDSSYKDALAASALAGKCNGLVLMTKKGSLTPQTKAALKASGVKNVYILGSTANVSAAVEKQLKSGTGVTKVVRVSATTPSQRAVAAAKYGGKKSDTVIIATQNGFQDALSIAPYSYATKSPILYAETNKKLSTATLSYIKSAKYSKAIIVGGPIALPDSVEMQLRAQGGIKKANITRLAGANAYRTSELIANWSMGKLANGNHDKYKGKVITYVKFQPTVKMKADKLAVSTGQNWLDALSGAALCGKNKSVMLLADTKGGNHYANAVKFLGDYKPTMNNAYIFGGTSAVSAATATALENATK